MRYRRLFRSTILLIVIALATPSCGGGGGGTNGTTTAATGFRMLEIHPADRDIYVRIDTDIRVRFSEPLLPEAIDERNFLLSEAVSRKSVPGTVTMSQDRFGATLDPDQELLRNTTYRVRILPDITSISGRTLPEEYRTVFRTALNDEPQEPPPPPPPKGSLKSVGPMKVGRSSHTSTLLENGDVLVAGGFRTSYLLTSTAEVFDPDTETFRYTSTSLKLARGYHTATRLTNGYVLLAGGLSGTTLGETPTVELYDPGADRIFPSSTSMVSPRAFHTATLLADGRVLITGGTVPTASGTYSSRKAEVYQGNSDGTGTFTSLPDMQVYRAGHTATRLSDGRVVLMGGNSSDRRVEIFDPETDTFSLADGELKVARRGHSATRMSDGNILVMGGGDRSAELYIVKSDYFLWAPGTPLYERRDHTADITTRGSVLFAGGASGTLGDSSNPLFFNRTTELYDPSSGAFLGSGLLLDQPKTRLASTVLKDGSILITGGSNVDPEKPEWNTAQIYDLD